MSTSAMHTTRSLPLPPKRTSLSTVHEGVQVELKSEKRTVLSEDELFDRRSAKAASSLSSTDDWEPVPEPGRFAPEARLISVPGVPLTEGKLSAALGGKVNKSVMNVPPALNVVPQLHNIFRFRVSSSISLQNCGVGGILGALGVICTVVNSNSRTVAGTFRINYVDCYPPAATTGGGSSDNVFLEWSASTTGFIKDEIKVAMLPDGITVPRRLRFMPPKGSLASFWMSSSLTLGNGVFALTAPAGAVVDLSITYTLCGSITPVSIAIASGALGSFYYLALDGPAANKIVPVGLSTTS